MYIHKVQYYETDKMAIVHHSNYIRWMEEARIDFFARSGCDYLQLEKEGIISPVISVECSYKKPAVFGDEIEIEVKLQEFKGVKLIIEYTMKNSATGSTVAEGRSSHCFTDMTGRPVILKRQFPEYDRLIRELAAQP